ncbi:peritrophin-44 [Drosophila albomicans]|uniref:Peritrophin-44 n=1 Tax=Drosophila albomicans TaxID=7291 RepID=A0A6P8X8P9_DROAB|nr:peritrophin-44 [Drosophila albomicans]
MQVLLALLAFAALLELSSQTEYVGISEDICRLFPDGTKLRQPGYCDRWIVCKDFKSTTGGTCTAPQVFNLNKGACQASLEKSDTYCDSPCSSKTSGYVGDTFNCANWYYCDKATTLSSGICPYSMHFDQNQQMCVYPKDAMCTAQFELVQVVPAKTNIKDESNCDKYLTASAGKLTTVNCTTDLYYDVYTGACIKKSLVQCAKHPLPTEVCGNKKLAIRNKFVADGATCRGYFYCHDLGSGVPDPSPLWQQCPVAYFFNEERSICEERAQRKCVEDRCDGRDDGFEVAEVPGCQHYIKCVNGAQSGDILECDDGMYFDALAQKCTTVKQTYGACSE